jgi:phage terminase large subunit-like protein
MTIPQDQWKHWTPAAQEKAVEALKQRSSETWRPFYCPNPHCDGNHHIDTESPVCAKTGRLHVWAETDSRWQCVDCGAAGTPRDRWLWRHAREDQRPPGGDWLTWFIRGGRGGGKTRTGSEWTNRMVRVAPRFALIGPTGTSVRDVMVEGESGILATSRPEQRPAWEPSKRKLTWPNGAIAHTYSGEEPDRLRGPQHHAAWIDEPAHIPLIDDVWSNLLFGLRLGTRPRICATTTPLPSKWVKELMADPMTVSVAASTYANLANLAPQFAATILRRYEGTRKGKQEIYGEVLADVEGALWSFEDIERHRILDAQFAPLHYDRIVVAIDPAGSIKRKADETGLVVVAVSGTDYYVLEDASGKYSPNAWATRAVNLMEKWSADCLIVERNYGGDMVRTTLENADQQARIVEVTSRRGKVIRADPVVALYERGLVHHVGAELSDLEDQLLGWVPGTDSPDRLDALVHGITDLAKIVEPAAVADPRSLRNQQFQSPFRHLRSVS